MGHLPYSHEIEGQVIMCLIVELELAIQKCHNLLHDDLGLNPKKLWLINEENSAQDSFFLGYIYIV